MTNRRDPQWRETATDSELFEHLHRTIERVRSHLDVVDMTPDGKADVAHLRVLLGALDRTADEITLRTDDRELMDAVRPPKPEPVADPLLDLLRDIEDAEARGDVTPEGGVILRPIEAVAPVEGEHVDGLALIPPSSSGQHIHP